MTQRCAVNKDCLLLGYNISFELDSWWSNKCFTGLWGYQDETSSLTKSLIRLRQVCFTVKTHDSAWPRTKGKCCGYKYCPLWPRASHPITGSLSLSPLLNSLAMSGY